ncbi:MAG: hypothetical protein KF833_04840 [Verrucomicrobiae bacterium]|nr:hypothetical protein [Verrucomicrobiae bacterium]
MNARFAAVLLGMALPTSLVLANAAEPSPAAPPGAPGTVGATEGREVAPALPAFRQSTGAAESIPAALPVRVLPPLATPGMPLNEAGVAGVVGTGAEVQWLSEPVELRVPTAAEVRTNRVSRTRGALPEAGRTERRGVGGFLAGLAGLFNPLAPVERGVAVPPAHAYDGQLQPAPLPRGFRDERYHEPRVEVLLVDFEPVSRPGGRQGSVEGSGVRGR